MFTRSCLKIQTLCILQRQIKRNQVFLAFFFFLEVIFRCLECKKLNLKKLVITKNADQKKKLLFDTSNKKFIQILTIIAKNLKENSPKIENMEENKKERECDDNSASFQDSNSEKMQNFNESKEKKENNIIEKEKHANIHQNPENSENEKKEQLEIKLIENSDEKKRDVVSNDKIQIEEFKVDLSERENRKEIDFSENNNEKILKKNQSQEIKIERSGSFSFQSKEVNLKSNPIFESNDIFGLKNVGNSCNKLK